MVFRFRLQRKNIGETLAGDRLTGALVPEVRFVLVALSCLETTPPAAVGCADRLAIQSTTEAFVARDGAAYSGVYIGDAIAAGFGYIRKQVGDVHVCLVWFDVTD